MNLKSMSLDKLSRLKDQVDAALSARIADERHGLQARLSALSNIGNGPRRGRFATRGMAVAAKYRNPENPSETWAGRGLKPRWLTAALKAGHRIEDFLIAATPAKRGRKAATKSAKPVQRRAGRRKAPEQPSAS
jgi:DNA-binding protein H-NS